MIAMKRALVFLLALAAAAAPVPAATTGQTFIVQAVDVGDVHWRAPVLTSADLPAGDDEGSGRIVLTGVDAGLWCRLGGVWSQCGGGGGGGGGSVDAADVTVADAGGYYASPDAEGVLGELGPLLGQALRASERTRTVDCGGRGDYTTIAAALSDIASVPLGAGRGPKVQWVVLVAPCEYLEPTGLEVPRWVTLQCWSAPTTLDNSWGDNPPCQWVAADGDDDMVRLGDSAIAGGWLLNQPNTLVGGPHAMVAHSATGGYVSLSGVTLHSWVEDAVGIRMDSTFSDRLVLDGIRVIQEGGTATKGIVYSSNGPGWIHGAVVTTEGVGGAVGIEYSGSGDLTVVDAVVDGWTNDYADTGSGSLRVGGAWSSATGSPTPWLPPHSATHGAGAGDELAVETLTTAGTGGTAPVSDGAGGLTMTDIATQGEFDSHVSNPAAHHAPVAPAGAGSELQYKTDASTFCAVAGSSVTGSDVLLAGDVSIGDEDGDELLFPGAVGSPFSIRNNYGVIIAGLEIRCGDGTMCARIAQDRFDINTQNGLYMSSGFGPVIRGDSGSVGLPSVGLGGLDDVGFYRVTTDIGAAIAGNAEQFRWMPSGVRFSVPLSSAPQSVTCADTGDASPGSLVLAPTSSVMHLTLVDADGCDLSASEVGVADGQELQVIIVSVAGAGASMSEAAGVVELAGAWSGGVWDVLTLRYTVDRFVEVGRSDN